MSKNKVAHIYIKIDLNSDNANTRHEKTAQFLATRVGNEIQIVPYIYAIAITDDITTLWSSGDIKKMDDEYIKTYPL
ncbi:hypothetical protein [Vibrio algicola]|uniref:Uncharacterized protein n=1 Tax=Vibrio algicola TaxID=2662262 RepID=A0A5Q0THA3_9VIBR|nr:hypothetical protein [Vibrio algicola]